MEQSQRPPDKPSAASTTDEEDVLGVQQQPAGWDPDSELQDPFDNPFETGDTVFDDGATRGPGRAKTPP